MDLAARIEQLDRLVREAKAMPLSSSVLVPREDLLDLIEQMREALPEEIKQARWVVRDREELLAKARQEGDAIREQARADQLKMAEQEEIVKRAHEEAARILARAQDAARDTRVEAETYVDHKLAQFEIVMRKAVEQLAEIQSAMTRIVSKVEQGRERLRDPLDLPEESVPARVPFDEEGA